MKKYSQDWVKVSSAYIELDSLILLRGAVSEEQIWEAIKEAHQILGELMEENDMEAATVELDSNGVRSAFHEIDERKYNKVGPKIVKHGKIDRQYNQQLDGVGNPACPLYDKEIRITGTFEQLGMSRDGVAAACQRLGAKKVSEGIAKSMQVVIMGNNAGPSKMEKVKKWQADGCNIMVISQYDLKKIFEEYPEALQE